MKNPLSYVWDKVKDKKVRFPDGRVYSVGTSGAITRLYPQRPWRGKSERRRVIAARRQLKAEASA
jgi:hypothetical protein